MKYIHSVKTRSQHEFLFQFGILICTYIAGTQLSYGQQFDSSISLGDQRTDVARLDATSPNGSTVFLVDDACIINIELLSDVGTLTTSIGTACGSTLYPETVSNVGGEFRKFEVPDSAAGACIFFPSLCVPGHHYVYSFPSQGAGEYTLNFSAPFGAGEPSVSPITSKPTTNDRIKTNQ